MNWSDEDIDKLFQESAEKSSFEFREEYWEEFEKYLPVNKKRGGVVWYLTSFLFLALTSGMLFIDYGNVNLQSSSEKISYSSDNNVDAQVDLSNIETHELEPVKLTKETYITVKQEVISELFDKINTGVTVMDPSFNIVDVSRDNSLNAIDENNVNVTLDDEGSITPEVRNSISTLKISKLNRELDEISAIPVDIIKMPLAGSFYIELNSGIQQSRITPSSSCGFSYGFGAGFQFQKNKFGFSAGIGTSVIHPGDMTLSRLAKVYGFGSDLYQYELKYNRFYVLDAQLSFNYYLGRHGVGATFRPSYIYNTKVTYSSASNDGSEPSTPINSSFEENNEVRSVYGYMDGLNRFGLYGGINYKIKLNQDLEFGINAGVQFRPQINQAFINGTNRVLPVEGQLFLRKSIHLRN